MNKGNIQWFIIVILSIISLSLGTLIITQNINKNNQDQISSRQVGKTSLTVIQPNKENSSTSTADLEQNLNTECARAKVREDYKLSSDGSNQRTLYSISIDGKKLDQSTVSSDSARITYVQVSSDCKSIAWVVASNAETDNDGNYIKPEQVRTTLLSGGTIKDFVMPDVGPASLAPFNSDTIITSLGEPAISEIDVPSEDQLSGTFYSINVGSGKIDKLGGPFLSVSPDLQKIVKKTGEDIVLQNKTTGKIITLAKGNKEFAYGYVFSPDSRNLAYLRLAGDRDTIFTILFRPIGIDDQTIVSGKLIVQPTDGSKEYSLITGGYNINSGWQIDRWLSPNTLQYIQSEYSARDYKVDFSTNPPSLLKQGLIDWDSV